MSKRCLLGKVTKCSIRAKNNNKLLQNSSAQNYFTSSFQIKQLRARWMKH